MKHDSHATASPRQTGRRQPRPDLGRPSLFADFDQDSVEDVSPQRIRLLSTLESQRGVRGRPRAQRLPTGRTHPWLSRGLMVAMGLGMLVMLLSFIQLLRRPPPTLPVPQAMAATATVARAAEASVSSTVLAAPVEAAEIIDMSPPAGGEPQSPMLVLPTSPATTQATANATAAMAETGRQVAPANTPRPTAVAMVSETERGGRTAKPALPRPGSAKRDAGASHDDVALVEAMLAHSNPRKTQPAPTVALQQCGSGSSAETAVCRARVCVQNPSLPACHTP